MVTAYATDFSLSRWERPGYVTIALVAAIIGGSSIVLVLFRKRLSGRSIPIPVGASAQGTGVIISIITEIADKSIPR